MESCYWFFLLGNQCSKAVAIFENDERFKAVERDRDRKDMFDSFLEELVNKVHYLYYLIVQPFINPT
jgi:hypothetical protein